MAKLPFYWRPRWPLYRREVWWLILALGMIALSLTGLHAIEPAPITGLIRAVSDPYYRFGPTHPSREVVFVAVDHRAVKALGRWPWPRDQLGRGLTRLQGARVVALDMVFSEPTEPARDQSLADAIAASTTVGGFLLNGPQTHALTPQGMQQLGNSALTEVSGMQLIESRVAELSIDPVIARQTLLASLNTLPDADERFRHYPAAFVLSGMALPSLGLQTLQAYLNETAQLRGTSQQLVLGAQHIALDPRGFTRLNLYPEASFSTISFADILNPDFDAAKIRDKIVIVGITEAGVSDIRATPLGQYPGPLMHATFVANALDGLSLREINRSELAAAILLTLGLTTLALGMRHMALRLVYYPALGSGLWLVGLYLYRAHGLWVETAYLLTATLFAALAVESSLLTHARRHTEKLRQAFSSYLPPGLVSRIVEDPDRLRLGGEKKEITVLFSDIRGFTSMSEHIPPETLAQVMSDYFQPMTEAIFAHGGTLDKYIGDAIMALFNAPLDQPNHAIAACQAAIAMQKAQLKINEKLAEQGLPPLRTGIGINTGPAIVGNLGSSIRFNYTAIGDTVNLASRLESATKKMGVDILIGETVYLAAKNNFPCIPLGTIEIPGKERAQDVFSLEWTQC